MNLEDMTKEEIICNCASVAISIMQNKAVTDEVQKNGASRSGSAWYSMFQVMNVGVTQLTPEQYENLRVALEIMKTHSP